MQSLFILFTWLALIGLGTLAPFVFGLAYIWVDLFRPQDVATAIIPSIPISMLTALLGTAAYLLRDRRDPPPLNTVTVLTIIWAIWITLTTTWAAFPMQAWAKWDWAFKTVIFTAILPLLFRSRVQIEAAILVVVFSIFSNVIPFAIKTALGSGGYHRALGLVPINGGWGGEGSTLATYAIATIPLIGFLARHSLLVPNRGLMKPVYAVAPVLALMGSFGTFARAGLVAAGVWAAITWWSSRRKLLLAALMCAGVAVVVPVMGDRWLERMSTTTTPSEEASALTRLLVWRWTIDYALANPQGGGFDVYLANRATITLEDGTDFQVEARAFHSLYFEILGEQGIVGAVIFAALMAAFYVTMFRLMRRTRGVAEFAWLHDLCRALVIAATCYLAGAAFIGIAFQPLHYYFLAFAVAARHWYYRAAAMAAAPDRPGIAVGTPMTRPRQATVRPASAARGWRARAHARLRREPT